MQRRLRKFMLTLHVATSVGLLGAVAGFLVLAVAGVTSQDAEMVRSVYLAMSLTTWVLVLPLMFTALVMGVIQSLGTRWGLFQHYWIVVKLLLTAIAAIVLVLQLQLINRTASAAAAAMLSSPDLREGRLALVVHSGGGLVLLLAILGLSIYKPRGRTGYGRRRT